MAPAELQLPLVAVQQGARKPESAGAGPTVVAGIADRAGLCAAINEAGGGMATTSTEPRCLRYTAS